MTQRASVKLPRMRVSSGVLQTAVTGLLLLPHLVGQAAVVTVNVSVTVLTSPECRFREPTTLIDFSTIESKKIDGKQYKQAIDYGLTCDNLTNNAVTLTVDWANNLMLGGQAAIQSTLPGLGIAIYHGDTRLGKGASVDFTNGNPPALSAVPVKATGTALTEGGLFTGVMTMTVNYQ